MYTWSLITRPPNSNAALSATNIVNPTFVTDQPGTYVAQLTVNNGFLNSTTPSTVTVTTVDMPPLANAGRIRIHPWEALCSWMAVSRPTRTVRPLLTPGRFSPFQQTAMPRLLDRPR